MKGNAVTLRALILCCCASQLLTGCLYLHNPTRQKAAEEARSNFEEMLKHSAASAVVADYVTQVELRSAVTRDLNRLDRTVMLDALLAQQWTDLVDATREELTTAQAALAAAKTKRETLKTELTLSLAKLANVEGKVKDSLEALNAASQ